MLFSDNSVSDNSLILFLDTVFPKAGTLIAMLCLTVLFVRYIRVKGKTWNTALKTVIVSAGFLAISGCLAFTASLSIMPEAGGALSARMYAQLFTVTLAAEIICYSLVYMIDYAFSIRAEMFAEREKTRQAEFQYARLKQQVNPHFLFNSLNTLDCMIQENSNREASEYTHKLAEVYRYMLRSEDESLVRLSQEMDFVSRYMELQRLRFGGGVELELNIADEAMNRSVVPCSVQLLVENALKHNAVRPDNPLKIEIRTTRNSVMVSNEKRPRLTPPRSAGMGQRYLRQRYKDIAGKSIVIRETEDKYIVILPLL